MTSRGCPGHCTFCAKNVVWGTKYRAHSVDYVLNLLEATIDRLPLKMLMVKDDTFTANQRRALAICQGIVDRGINFVWSCDTRADALNAELLRAMRLAGCQLLSFGVESGSAAILANIKKNVSPETIASATELAKQYGLTVRYFMMLGNRGETATTFRESLAFVDAAQPHQSIFACLSVYPGTDDFVDLERAGEIDREAFFTEDFQELKLPFDASAEDTALMSDWFQRHIGVQEHHRAGVDEAAAVLERLGEYHAAHLDLAAAQLRAGLLEEARHHVERALALGFPLPGLAHNHLACIAARRGDTEEMERQFSRAMQGPPHAVIVRNLGLLNAWRARQIGTSELAAKLAAHHDFQLLEPPAQPMLPGMLPEDFASFSRAG
jgi:hypothetical protein